MLFNYSHSCCVVGSSVICNKIIVELVRTSGITFVVIEANVFVVHSLVKKILVSAVVIEIFIAALLLLLLKLILVSVVVNVRVSTSVNYLVIVGNIISHRTVSMVISIIINSIGYY